MSGVRHVHRKHPSEKPSLRSTSKSVNIIRSSPDNAAVYQGQVTQTLPVLGTVTTTLITLETLRQQDYESVKTPGRTGCCPTQPLVLQTLSCAPLTGSPMNSTELEMSHKPTHSCHTPESFSLSLNASQTHPASHHCQFLINYSLHAVESCLPPLD